MNEYNFSKLCRADEIPLMNITDLY